MKVCGNAPVVCYDCDDTLVMWSLDPKRTDIIKIDTGNGHFAECNPHHKHIQSIKDHKSRGQVVIIWSAGGGKWAEAVVKALGLEEYVDVCMSKPSWIYDDLSIMKWMPESKYIGKRPVSWVTEEEEDKNGDIWYVNEFDKKS